jgi:hypothetical protein
MEQNEKIIKDLKHILTTGLTPTGDSPVDFMLLNAPAGQPGRYTFII